MNKPITIAVCFFLSFVFVAGLIWPRYQDFILAQEKARDIRAELQFRGEYLEKLGNVSEQLEKYKEPLAIIDSALPDALLPSVLFDWVESRTAQTGLTLKEISVESTTPVVDVDVRELQEEDILEEDVPKLQETKVLLKVSGSYDSFKNFLAIMENSARLIKIENISFDSPKEEDPFTFNIKIKVYSY